jgi:fused signal recognition particle receptor
VLLLLAGPAWTSIPPCIVVVGVILFTLFGGLVVGGRRRGRDRSLPGPSDGSGSTAVQDRDETALRDRDDTAVRDLDEPPLPDIEVLPEVPETPAELFPPEAPPVPVEELSLGGALPPSADRTRNVLGVSVADLFGRGVTDEAWEGLEEALIGADVGVTATMEIVEELKRRSREEGVTTAGVLELLKQELRARARRRGSVAGPGGPTRGRRCGS